MCAIFGLIDYNNYFNSRQREKVLKVLSKECEVRGTDATGFAYIHSGGMSVFKCPLAAHKVRLHLPFDSNIIMGHTRMATQGDKKDNFNNHPFTGRCGDMPFALAHNGVLHNDVALRKAYKLPDTPIKTDSYIAVQLLEQSKCLDFDSIAAMAEQLEGSYTFTILDMASNMYFVKGDNPLALYHFEREGFYIYASTEVILDSALTKLGFANKVCVEIDSTCGDILRIDSSGKLSKSLFDTSLLYALNVHYSYRPYWWDGTGTVESRSIYEPAAIANLKEFAGYVGIDPDNIEVLLEFGYSTDEIEDMLYTPDGIELALEEIFYNYCGEEW